MVSTKNKQLIVFLFLASLAGFAQQSWKPLGPEGGDARSFSADPKFPDKIFLGTPSGQLYLSNDNGHSWERSVRIGQGNDFVIDHVVINPQNPQLIHIAVWSVEKESGAMFRSRDGGKTWESVKAMDGKSIRALTAAPSDPNILVAGALDGVYRSTDGGKIWTLISPTGSSDFRNFESIAIDPVNPEVIYAGTWHLPYKTMDGGKTWKSIKNGIIDDSDVFSIIIDPKTPSTVYASACSGIYKSDNGGELFRKMQGIPSTARRTRVLHQDPVNSDVVYAGTTEGLWKTVDAGKTWKRMTAPNVIVNDIMVDWRNPKRVLLATDRSGVLASDDAGVTFSDANRGFSHRQVSSLLVDKSDPNKLYAGLINDKEYGGVFVSRDLGERWSQVSAGLGGRDVFTLKQTGTGELVAGTNRGVFLYRPRSGDAATWQPINTVIAESISKVPAKTKSKTKAIEKTTISKSELNARVNDIEILPAKWYAATSSGLFYTTDEGKMWKRELTKGESDFIAVRTSEQMVVAAARKALVVSLDGGKNWYSPKLPPSISLVTGISFGPDKSIWIAGREGAFRSSDGGDHWEYLWALPVNNLGSLTYDRENNRMLVTSLISTEMFESRDGRNWKRAQSGWLLRSLVSSGGKVLATTPFDGVVAQRELSASAAQARLSTAPSTGVVTPR